MRVCDGKKEPCENLAYRPAIKAEPAKGFGAELAAEIAWDCAAAAETSCALTLPPAALREPTECRGDAARSKAMAPSRNDIAESAMAACMASKNYVWAG
jgi:hypothetical protein